MVNWEKQEGSMDFWNPEVAGAELIGQVTEIKTAGQFGTQYMIKKEDGTEILTPSHKVLQAKMSKVEVGNKVKLVFIKQDLPKVKNQQGVKLYDVFIDQVEEQKI